MSKIANFALEMCEKLELLIGHQIPPENIISDDPGFNYYVQNLRTRHPVFIVTFYDRQQTKLEESTTQTEHPLYLVLPLYDYRRLESHEETVERYLAEAYFCYGRLIYDGTPFGAYWQPLEKGTGIHDTQSISRYLGELKAGRTNGTPMYDGRQELLTALRKWISQQLGFGITSFKVHIGEWNIVQLYADTHPDAHPDVIRVSVSQTLLHELLYDPRPDCDFMAFIESLLRFLCKHPGVDGGTYLVPGLGNLRQTCLDFWGREMSVAKQHQDRPPANETPANNSRPLPRKHRRFIDSGLWDFLRKLKLFGI